MAKYDVKVRYAFEGTYTVMAEDRDEAERMVSEECGLVLGGNIHTTLDDEEVVNWHFGVHPDMQLLSITQRNGRGTPASIDFSGRIEELRKDIIDAIRELLQSHCMNTIRIPEDDYDPVWVIWFNNNGDPYECRVTGLHITGNSLTVYAEEKEGGYEVECYSPFELGAKNIDWLQEIYDVVWRQLEGENNVESQNRES